MVQDLLHTPMPIGLLIEKPESQSRVRGYALTLAGGAVCWVSRKQKTVALSSTEAEYMSMSDASRQIMWVQNLFLEIGFPQNGIDLLCDNQGAIFLASNPAQQHKSKHIDIRYHYIRERIEQKQVRLYYVPTNSQIADLMTKNLNRDKIKFFLNELGITVNTTPWPTAKCVHKSRWQVNLSSDGLNHIDCERLFGIISYDDYIRKLIDPKVDKRTFGDRDGNLLPNQDKLLKQYEPFKRLKIKEYLEKPANRKKFRSWKIPLIGENEYLIQVIKGIIDGTGTTARDDEFKLLRKYR